MNRSVVAAVGLAVALAGAISPPQAQAADLPSPLAPVAPAPAFDWSGAYVEGFAGGSFADVSQGYSVSSPWLSANLPALLPVVDGLGSQGLGLRGADLGLEAGYNWTIDRMYVLGVAGDVSWSSLSGQRTTSGTLPFVGLPYTINQQLSADWLGSLRLRAGFTPLDNLLIYVTGGPAFAHFSYNNAFVDTLVAPFLPGNETESASVQALRVGFTLGAGVEWAFSRNWSLSGEYRFSGFNGVSATGVLPLQQPTSTAYINHSTGPIQINTLRLGVAYHFN